MTRKREVGDKLIKGRDGKEQKEKGAKEKEMKMYEN